MKKLLPICAFVLVLLSFVSLIWPVSVSAGTVRGCPLEGPADAQNGSTAYVCNAGVSVGGYTCEVAQTQAATVSWKNASGQTGTPAKQTTVPAGCSAAVDFLSSGTPRVWLDPTLATQGDDVEDCVNNTNLSAGCMWVFNLRSTFAAGAGAIAGYPTISEDSPAVVMKGGATQFFASSIGTMTKTPPASSIDYIAYMGRKLQVPGATPALAASAPGGFGYNALSPILELWSLARNIAYLFFAIAFVIVGIQIMFGTKLKDQKTALSIQMALPKIIIALILVTFSYAIAGFLIDLMYVSIQLIFSLLTPYFASDPVALNDLKVAATSGNESIFAFALHGWKFEGAALLTLGQAVGTIVDSVIKSVITVPIVGQLLGGAGGFIAGSLVALVIAFALLYSLFKIWLKLIMSYVQIILAVIGAPLILMMDALPGSNNFANWIKNLLANILMFPVVVIMIFLSFIITTNFGKGVSTGGFVPPLIGATGGPEAIQVLIGMGILLTIPKILDQLPTLIGAAEMFKGLGSAWTEPVQNNYLSKRAGEYSAAKEATRKADMERRLSPPKEPDVPLVPRIPAPIAPSGAIMAAANNPAAVNHAEARAYMQNYNREYAAHMHSRAAWAEYDRKQDRYDQYNDSRPRRFQKWQRDQEGKIAKVVPDLGSAVKDIGGGK